MKFHTLLNNEDSRQKRLQQIAINHSLRRFYKNLQKMYN